MEPTIRQMLDGINARLLSTHQGRGYIRDSVAVNDPRSCSYRSDIGYITVTWYADHAAFEARQIKATVSADGRVTLQGSLPPATLDAMGIRDAYRAMVRGLIANDVNFIHGDSPLGDVDRRLDRYYGGEHYQALSAAAR